MHFDTGHQESTQIMSAEYAARLKEFNTSSEANHAVYQHVLLSHHHTIIKQFGSLDTMIELCLTNPRFSSLVDESNFESFQNLMKSNKIDINMNQNNNNHTTNIISETNISKTTTTNFNYKYKSYKTEPSRQVTQSN